MLTFFCNTAYKPQINHEYNNDVYLYHVTSLSKSCLTTFNQHVPNVGKVLLDPLYRPELTGQVQ